MYMTSGQCLAAERARYKLAGKHKSAAQADLPEETVLDRVLGTPIAADTRALHEARVLSWSGEAGVLEDGSAARLGASCLLQPEAGDLALVWEGGDAGRWTLAVLQRRNAESAAVLRSPGPIAFEAPRVGVTAGTFQVAAETILTSARNHHAVEDTSTQTSRVRVAQVSTDIRRATTVDDKIEGAFLQRIGTWLSTTAREARMRARTFLFE